VRATGQRHESALRARVSAREVVETIAVKAPTSGGGDSSGWWPRLAIVLAMSSGASLALAGCLSTDTKDRVNQQINYGMRTSEVGIARVVAARVAQREDADVSATATISKASPSSSPGSHTMPCTTGRLIHITLVGTFPRARADPGSAPVLGEALTVDAATGRLCESQYLTEPIVSDPMSVSLFSK